MPKCFLDTETCGLHGVAITLQYAFDDGPIEIHEFWVRPISESIALLDKIAQCEVVGFNLAFDWFHLAKMRTILALASEKFGPDEYLDEHIDEVGHLEEVARDGKCYKPKTALDLMLHARKTNYQMTMDRKDIRIRRVPTALAWELAKELEERFEFDEILFARRANKLAPKWTVLPTKSNHFKNVVLKFKPSIALKALAVCALKIPLDEITTFAKVEVDKYYRPKELGYAPFAKALSTETAKGFKWNGAWPEVVEHHIKHWSYNAAARDYAKKDVEYTRRLYYFFNKPPTGDDDSELACSVGAVRWRGYAVDIEGLKQLKREALDRTQNVPTAPRQVKIWISQCLSDEEKAIFESTNKKTLTDLASRANGETCPFGKCELCNNTGQLPGQESGKRALLVLEARGIKKEIELYDKLIKAGRFHASFKVIGALSGRMSGADKLNPQGIKKTKTVRSKFPLAFGDLQLRGGDFSGFEVVLAVAAYGDTLLEKDLLTCEKCRDVQVEFLKGKKKCPKCGGNKTLKIHALFGVHVFPPMTYDEIKATDGTDDDKYTRSKSAVFAIIYGGEGYTLAIRLMVPIEVANEAVRRFKERYPGVAKAQKRIEDAFCTLRQEGGIGSPITYRQAAEFVESLLGFKRYFTLENTIVKALFDLAEKPPEEWNKIQIKVRRRADKEQTASGALRSAVFGAAFQIQAAEKRAAANHEIQSSGAGITKHVQRKIWDIQPSGYHEWLVQPMNIHDEILNPTHLSVDEQVAKTVFEAVESFREKVPLIEFEWKEMSSWAAK
jgi:hypothetical protein